MIDRRRIALATATGSLVAALALACDSEERASLITDAGSDSAALPPPSDIDAGSVDAAIPPDEPVVCAVSPCVTQITAGRGHYCALIQDGTVRCWGDNSRGQLGFAEDRDSGAADGGAEATSVVGLANVTQVSTAAEVSCARLESGAIACWGNNEEGALGYIVDGGPFQDTEPHPTPTTIPLPGPSARVDVLYGGMRAFACATLATGEPWCWGSNFGVSGLLARNSLDETVLAAAPGLADRLLPFGAIRFAPFMPLAITAEHRLIGWGFVSGRDAPVYTAGMAYPIMLSLTGVSDVASSDSHACAVTEGHVECWRHNTWRGYICDGTGAGTEYTLPRLARTKGSAHPRQLVTGAEIYGTCVRMSDGTVQCCGTNSKGGLGTGTVEGGDSIVFTEASALAGHVVAIAASNESVCALLRTGEVKCWGGNSKGELGQGSKDDDPHPVPLTVKLQ